MIHTETDLWKAAIDLVVEVYRVTPVLPRDERFGLAIQMKRAAASIPSNVAEGAGRETDPDNKRFLFTARGSLNELATQLIICERLGYLEASGITNLSNQIVRVRQLLAGMIRSLG